MAGSRAPRGGIDLGGTKIQAVVVGGDLEVLGAARHPTPQAGGPPAVIEALAAALGEAAEAAGCETHELAGIGLGSPGDIDTTAGTVSRASNLPDWEGDVDVAARLGRAVGTDVFLGNDVSVAVQAEFAIGAGKEFESLIGVWWGTGVGSGVILGGEQWHGRGAAGEIGHMVVEMNGARCPCGRRGCVEAYAGRRAMESHARERHDNGEKTDLFKLMKEKGRDRLTSGIWERALHHGDEMTTEIFDRAYRALGAGIASAVNLLDVQAIILGGGLGTRFGDAAAQRLLKEMHPHLFNDARPPVVLVAALGDVGGAVGAAMLVPPGAGAAR